MEVQSFLPIIPIIVAGVAGILTFVNGDKTFWRNLYGTVASVIAFVSIASMLPGVLDGIAYNFKVVDLIPGLSINFRVDSLGMMFGIVSSSMWVLVNIYTIGYMEHEGNKQRFFAFFSLSLFSAFGIAFSENLFTFFLFYEFLSLATYPLVIHSGTEEAMKAGSRYLIYTLGGGGFFLAAIVITYVITGGNITLSQPGLFTLANGELLLKVLFFIYLIGVSVKAAVMPLHLWLPSAMVAPTPVSTLLHAVAVVKAGAFGVLRLIYNIYGVDLLEVLGVNLILAFFAGVTIIVASTIAIRQDNLKRRLAYSTVSQLSYIVLGAALLSPAAAIGAMVHIANHAFTKGTLFMCAGIIAEETGKKNISELGGMGKRLPLTMAAFSIGAMGMIGMPPLAGFMSKWYLGIGAGEVQQTIFMMVLVASSILNAIYFLPILYKAYFEKAETTLTPSKGQLETVPTMLVPIMATATMSIILGVFATAPGLPLSVAQRATAVLVGGS